MEIRLKGGGVEPRTRYIVGCVNDFQLSLEDSG